MAVIALMSPGGSPGVTTAALALALTWPRDVVIAECDPAGGAVLAGMWRGQAAEGGAGLLRFALAAQRDSRAAGEMIRTGALPLEDGLATRFVLPAPPGPLTARQLTAAWPAVAAGFAAATADVIADLGRFDADPALAPVLAGAARVLVVCPAADPPGRSGQTPAGGSGRDPSRRPRYRVAAGRHRPVRA